MTTDQSLCLRVPREKVFYTTQSSPISSGIGDSGIDRVALLMTFVALHTRQGSSASYVTGSPM